MATKPKAKAPRKSTKTALDLTPKQAAFVREYLIDLNATQAAIRAGYSAKTADVQGPRLLGNVGVRAAINAGTAKQAAKSEITKERVLAEFAKIGFVDIGGIFTPGGNLLDPHDMPDDVRAAVQSIEIVRRRVVGDEKHTEEVHKIKLADKIGALTQIGRHLGMFVDKHEHEVNGTVNITFGDGTSDL